MTRLYTFDIKGATLDDMVSMVKFYEIDLIIDIRILVENEFRKDDYYIQ